MAVLELLQTGFPYLTVSLIVAFTYIVYTKLRRTEKIQRMFETLKYPPQLPLLGNGFQLNVPNEDLVNLQFRLLNQYGSRYIMNALNIYYVALSDPVDLEKLLSSSLHIEKGQAYMVIRPWLGQGLLTSGGKNWQKRRKLLTPTFHFKILEDFMVVFNEQSDVLVDILKKDFANGKVNDICPYVTSCTLDVICLTAMDQNVNAQRIRDSPYVKAVNNACETMAYRFMRPWYWPNLLFNLTPTAWEYRAALSTLHSFTEKVIKERKTRPTERRISQAEAQPAADDFYWKGKRRLAFLDLLIDAQKNPENELTDRDIREEVDTFMFEGHDTTAASIKWTLFMVALHPEYQAKVHEEMDKIFGDDRSRPITSKDLTEMKYLEMCIKEALRLFPSVPFMARELTHDLILDEKTVIPAGVNICLLTMQVHYNPEIYPDPEKFQPDRFLPENTVGRHPYAYIPFSAGPRNCIGQKFAIMEEKVLLANIFRNFKLEAVDKREDVQVMISVITRPRDGIKMRMVPR